ncbi:MAG: hypothetical protein IPP51_13060 [Bacteroidetes bacterium]|nr:hypothetical protein [Bacteroidota bacterium]
MKSKIQLFLAGLFLISLSALGQSVSISPSRLYYKSGLGEYKTQEVNVTNSSTSKQAFTITFTDFEPSGAQGKSKFMKKGESEHSCSEWLSATPSFFELEPGQTQKIQVLIQVPASPEANKVKWAAMQVKLAKERKGGEAGDKNAIGMGITETFQFIVHIFQTPPTVVNKSANLVSFKEITQPGDSVRTLALNVENNGESILDCASYLEYTQTQTGEEQRQKPFAFTLLPGASREVKFQMPATLKGKYSVLGVVDIGSRENVLAAELEVDMK